MESCTNLKVWFHNLFLNKRVFIIILMFVHWNLVIQKMEHPKKNKNSQDWINELLSAILLIKDNFRNSVWI